jgi:hypothetical protein
MLIPGIADPAELEKRRAANRAKAKKWREANRDKARAAARKWNRENVEYVKARRREEYQRSGKSAKAKMRMRKCRLKRKYGITLGEYDAMFAAQAGLCAICRRESRVLGVSGRKILVVDHCHAAGRVRSLLCKHCNWMIGHAADAPGVLRQAAEYLERHAALAAVA